VAGGASTSWSGFSAMLIRRRRASSRPTASATNTTTAMATEIQITLDTRPSWHLAAPVSSAGQPSTTTVGEMSRAVRKALAPGEAVGVGIVPSGDSGTIGQVSG
jgi:hypothetical protein